MAAGATGCDPAGSCVGCVPHADISTGSGSISNSCINEFLTILDRLVD
jgi:hypothetical protein